MKKRILTLLLFLLPLIVFAELDHLIITEVVLQPGYGEYIEIYNPTEAEIDLTNYYLTDATDTANAKFYYNLPGGTNYHSGTGSDFTARFPQGSKIPAGASIIISMATAINYNSQYDSNPDLSIKDDFLNAIDGILSIGGAPYYLDNVSETLVLFYWDGVSSAVKDVDYLIWGDRQHAIDKSGVAGYFADTPIKQQEFMPVHIDGEKLQRISDEGDEVQTGGNGITGHDETSEKFSQTWQIVSVGNRKPEIGSISITPKNPTSEDKIRFTARVTDDGQVTVVNLIWYFNEDDKHTEPMTDAGNDYYTTTELGSFEIVDTLFYYVYAEDETGLNDSSMPYSVVLEEPEPELTIAYIRDNWDEFDGQTVTLQGVVTIGSNILRTDHTSAYFQDASGRGLNLYDSNITNLVKGDSIEVTGELDEYNGVYELKDFASSYTVLASNVPIPNVVTISVGALVEDPAAYEGSYFQINGTVTDRADNVGGGSNITIEDVTGRVTVRIWNSTGVLFDEIGRLVNEDMDSLLQIGNMVSVKGVGSLYKDSPQVLLGYAEDVEYYIPGEPGNEKTKLSVAPYPFVPQLGEVIKYSYEYPSNCRVILRVYDMSGRFITALEDGYYALSWHKENVWDGRNELNELVAPGNYLFHLQTTNRTNGKTRADIVPVVVGVKF